MKGINFREAEKGDLNELIRCWEEFMEYHLKSEDSSEKRRWLELAEDASEKRRCHFEGQIRGQNKNILLAENKNEIVGYATAILKNRPPIFKARKLGMVGELFVKEKYRNEGLGKELADRTVEWLESKGIELLKVRVLKMNKKANDFWNSRGFKNHIKIKFKEPEER